MHVLIRSLCPTLSMLAVCGAVAVAAAAGPFNDQPDSPRSLPADNLPPFGMLDDGGHLVPAPVIPDGAEQPGRHSAPESTAPAPSMLLAMEAARAAIDYCSAEGFRVGVAVVDSLGEARAALTADGSDGSHIFVAIRKALVALAFEMPSSQARAEVQRDPTLLALVKPNMFVEGGAVPIFSNDVLIGAIGVSGAAGKIIGQKDEVCAVAGHREIMSKLD